MRVSGVKYVQRETPFLATADPPQTTSVAEPLDLPGYLDREHPQRQNSICDLN